MKSSFNKLKRSVREFRKCRLLCVKILILLSLVNWVNHGSLVHRLFLNIRLYGQYTRIPNKFYSTWPWPFFANSFRPPWPKGGHHWQQSPSVTNECQQLKIYCTILCHLSNRSLCRYLGIQQDEISLFNKMLKIFGF